MSRYSVVMAQCWKLLPENRPYFSRLVEELRDYWEEEHAYVMEVSLTRILDLILLSYTAVSDSC